MKFAEYLYVSFDYRITAPQNNIVPPEETTDGYQVINLGFGCDFHLKGQKLSLSMQVQNLFNTKYFNHTSYYRLINVPEPGRTFILNITLGLLFTACQDTPGPEITLLELGYENSGIAYAGSDLHIELEIVAEGTIETVQVVIHPEGEHAKSASSVPDEDEWEVDTTYTKFSGLKNTTFHEHADVSVHAEIGDYHFHLIVTDMEGQQSSVEEELELQYPDDAVAPEITISSAPENNQEFSKGETISISGSVSDETALGGMYIGLVRVDQGLSDAEVNATNTITLLHTHDFDSPAAHNFSANIEVGSAQDNDITPKDITGDIAWQSASYYILVKCKDAFGGNWTFSDHYPVVISY